MAAGLARYEQHDYSGAIDRMNAAEQVAGEDLSLLDPTYHANTDCDHAISISPTNAHLHDIRGVAHTLLGDLDNASRHFATALTLDPKFARSYFDRGTMHTRRQNYDSAVKDFTSAIKLDPEFGAAYMSRGEAYQKMGRSHLAFQDFASATHHGVRFTVQSIENLDSGDNSSSNQPKK
jgi:tetratricopeptide (TPR) repeat protein